MTNECPICLLDGASFKTSCQHSFHTECLRKWALLNQTCPVCRGAFNVVDLSHLTRSGLWASRRVSENYVRQQFRASAMFVYPAREPTVFGATWVFHAHTPSWMSAEWVEHYRSRRGHTLEAFQLSQAGVHSVVHSVRGVPPARLFYCRICRQVVYSQYRFLCSHVALEHSSIN